MRSQLVMVLLTNVIMITTIYLNNQFSRKTSKICYVISYYILSPKRSP